MAGDIRLKLATPKPTVSKNRFRHHYLVNLTVSSQSRDFITNNRIKNWGETRACSRWVNKGSFGSVNCGQYSSRCRYIKYSYRPEYTSFLTFGKSGGGLVYSWGFTEEKHSKFVKAPKGMKFKVDDLGVKLVRLSDGMDYHPTSIDYTARDFAQRVRAEMAANFNKRLKSKRLQKQFKNVVSNTYVSFLDARRAGNCVSGILTWAKSKLNMDREALLDAPWLVQVPAKLLIRLDPNNNLVKNSISQAYLRETAVCI